MTKYEIEDILFSGKPSSVQNCTLANQTESSVEVKCVAGYDGGLPQKFVLEVYNGNLDSPMGNRPFENITNLEEPVFKLVNLKDSGFGFHVAVYAVNEKGRSQPINLSEVTYRDAEKRTGN